MQQPPNPQGQYPQQPPQGWQQQPQYQQQMPPPQPPLKKRSKLPLILGILAALLVLGCIGVFAAANSTKTNTGTAVNTSTSGNTPAASNNQHFKVGQTVKVGDTWQVTINSVKLSQGSQYFKPKSGMTWLVFSITAKNVSSQEQNISSELNFHLQDASGQKYTETIDPDAGATLDGKVEANSPSKGVIVYEVPTSTHDYQLTFEPDITSAGQTIWDIHL